MRRLMPDNSLLSPLRSAARRIHAAAWLTLALAACVSDTIHNRRQGQQLVCHDGDETLAVSNADSFVHLDHGDAIGPCPESP